MFVPMVEFDNIVIAKFVDYVGPFLDVVVDESTFENP